MQTIKNKQTVCLYKLYIDKQTNKNRQASKQTNKHRKHEFYINKQSNTYIRNIFYVNKQANTKQANIIVFKKSKLLQTNNQKQTKQTHDFT